MRKDTIMTTSIAVRLRRLASPRRPQAAGHGGRRAAALLVRLVCVALLAWIGAVHLHLWLEGYRQIPTDGPLFLLDAVTGLALAALLLVWDAPLAGLVAAGYTAGTLGALLISLSVGLFGFRESISASFVTQSLVVEAVTVLLLLGWTALVTAGPRRDGLAVRRSPAPQVSSGR
jgi:hypothetical protein